MYIISIFILTQNSKEEYEDKQSRSYFCFRFIGSSEKFHKSIFVSVRSMKNCALGQGSNCNIPDHKTSLLLSAKNTVTFFPAYALRYVENVDHNNAISTFELCFYFILFQLSSAFVRRNFYYLIKS